MYDYKVRNHVDFSKLFLATNIAIYTAFDETVDISALLGMIINIDSFPQNVQNTADQVKYYYYIYIYIYTKLTGKTISNLKIGSQIPQEDRKSRIKYP
jgi:K+/H+ antiporter YhaU regulatory subunit KhtT